MKIGTKYFKFTFHFIFQHHSQVVEGIRSIVSLTFFNNIDFILKI